MTTALTTRADLDKLRCEEPGCGHDAEIVLYPTCHPETLTIATYRRGELALECAECGQVYLTVPVAG